MPQPHALRLRSLVLEREAALSPLLLPQPLRPQHASHHMAHTISCRVRSRELFARHYGKIQPLGRYYHHRSLRWAGGVARMPVSRLPRKLPIGLLPIGFVARPRPTGCPDMMWGRSLKKTPKSTTPALNSERGRRSPRTECSGVRRCTPKTHPPPPRCDPQLQPPPRTPPRCISVADHLCTTRPDRTSV
jgi:hypothetical protein